MGDLSADNYDRINMTGSFGNGAVDVGKKTLAAAQINDVILFGKIRAGTTVHSMALQNAALGGSTTIKLGYRPVAGNAAPVADDDYWLAATSTSSLARPVSIAAPITFTKDVEVIGTVEGAAATGIVHAIVDYEYRGL